MSSSSRGKQLGAFKQAFSPEIRSAYYPFCGNDTTPWDTFPEATITGVDLSGYDLDDLREQGIDTVKQADVDEHPFDQHVDALFLLGWRCQPDTLLTLTGTVRRGGYVVTDSFMNAGEVAGRQKEDFSIAGRVGRDGEADTSPVEGGEATGLGLLRMLQDRHTSPRPIGTICLELELTRPEVFGSNLLVLRRE